MSTPRRRDFDHSVVASFGCVRAIAPATCSEKVRVSSNVERLLFELYERDGSAVAALMTELREAGRVDMGDTRLALVGEVFDGVRLDDDATRDVIGAVYRATGTLIDPHTARVTRTG